MGPATSKLGQLGSLSVKAGRPSDLDLELNAQAGTPLVASKLVWESGCGQTGAPCWLRETVNVQRSFSP